MTAPHTNGVGAHGRPVWDEEMGRRRCTANAKGSGTRCKNRPIPGGTVCRKHGGATPQAKAGARARLAAAVDPAIGTLLHMVTAEQGVIWENGEPVAIGPPDAVRVRAAEAILDRAGYPRRTEVDLTDSRERIVEQLRALRDGQEMDHE